MSEEKKRNFEVFNVTAKRICSGSSRNKRVVHLVPMDMFFSLCAAIPAKKEWTDKDYNGVLLKIADVNCQKCYNRFMNLIMKALKK